MSEQPAGKFASLWAATSASTGYAALDADLEVDVAVIGGGIAGLTAALALKRAGQAVAVLEAARVGTGVTGNTTGKVTSLHRLAYTELAGRHGAEDGPHLRRGQPSRNSACGLHGGGRRHRLRFPAGIQLHVRRIGSHARSASGRKRRWPPASDFLRPSPPTCRCRSTSRARSASMTRRRSTRSGTCRGWPAPSTGTAALSSRSRLPRGSGTGSPAVVDTERGSVRAREIIVATNMPIRGQGNLRRAVLSAPLIYRGRTHGSSSFGFHVPQRRRADALHPDHRPRWHQLRTGRRGRPPRVGAHRFRRAVPAAQLVRP